jgi:hypothetical protein
MSGISAWGGIFLAGNTQPEPIFDSTPRALLSQGRPFAAVHDFEHLPDGTGRILMPGEYSVMGFLTVEGSVAKNNIFALAVNEVPMEPHFHHSTTTAGSPSTGLFVSILTLATGDKLSVVGWSTNGGSYCLVRDAGFMLQKLPPRGA